MPYLETLIRLRADLGYTKVVLPDDFCGEIRIRNGYGIAHLGDRLELRSVCVGPSSDVFRVEPDNITAGRLRRAEKAKKGSASSLRPVGPDRLALFSSNRNMDICLASDVPGGVIASLDR